MVDPRVQADFDRLAGHVFKLRRVEAYIGDTDDQRTVVLDPPVEFKLQGDFVPSHILDRLINGVEVLPPGGAGHLGRVNDDWLDPIYDVEPVDPEDPQVAKYRSFYCYGKSYNLKTGAVEEGDVVSVRRIDGSWVMYV